MSDKFFFMKLLMDYYYIIYVSDLTIKIDRQGEKNNNNGNLRMRQAKAAHPQTNKKISS